MKKLNLLPKHILWYEDKGAIFSEKDQNWKWPKKRKTLHKNGDFLQFLEKSTPMYLAFSHIKGLQYALLTMKQSFS